MAAFASAGPSSHNLVAAHPGASLRLSDMDAPRSVYLDHHATTPVDPRVLEAMLPYFSEKFGNAASRSHRWGWDAEEAVEKARAAVAALIGGASKEIVFTSGATESNNLALKGVVEFNAEKRRHIVSVRTEHKAVLDSLRWLEKAGLADVTLLGVDREGLVDPATVEAALTEQTVLVSVMHANNEIGVLQPLAAISKICRSRGVFFHTDAAQSVGKVPVDVDSMGIDLLSISGHKFYGPKGVGALYVRSRNPRVRVSAHIHGGGHERGMRSGTLNVPGIVGLGAAAEIAKAELEQEAARTLILRERLREGLAAGLEGIAVHGSLEARLPGNLNVAFSGVDGESLMMGLKDIALSSGSACSSATLEPSYVLGALGVAGRAAHASIRFGVGRMTTAEDIDYAAERVIHEVLRLRALTGRGATRASAGNRG